ncbi:MAG: hypothetical protein F6J95_010660 [Leptolyngbya sp. SIO1E4]|nr:hypothetical protein [Leptolyngbya sp. SIO1E4]
MLPNSLENAISSLLPLTVTPDQEFLEATSFLDIVSTISPEAGEFLLSGLDELGTATGDLTITAGVATGNLTTTTGETISGSFDAPTFLSEFGETLATSTGTLSLAGGILNASLQTGDDLYTVENFDLATFAAEGLAFLLSSVDTTIPLENGVFLINAETSLGPISGSIDIADGDLDLSFDTFAGDIDVSFDFGPEAQFPFAVASPLGNVEAVVNLDSGSIEVPLVGTNPVSIPLSSLSGGLGLADGIATLDLDTQLGPINTSFEIAPLLNDVVVDTLTGLTVDANLTGGQLGLLATRGTEQFQTDVDLVALNEELVATLLTTNGSFTLGSGVFSGELTIGDDVIAVNQTVDGISQLLTTPFGDLDLLSPPPIA